MLSHLFPSVPTRRFWRRSEHQEVKPKPAMPAKPCRWRALYLALPLMVFLCGTSPAAKAVVPGTDANVVTAIDVSDSIGRYEEWLQQAGLVRALVHPDFLRAAPPARGVGSGSPSSHGQAMASSTCWCRGPSSARPRTPRACLRRSLR
ncbi:MAG: DUF1194 domain-containing protein [Mesorhizobium sp.]|uniref:DUF1194 domain-containing protein n=1 Tax=Mesorhizobium sp. ISC15 TaxID=3076429 RepID=UPI000F762098|nr:DUF1194 domain-containing protein [Mesorhizobium sp. M6A.T.Cr.TU.016.01.1.1]RWP48787.1 MAG: DUF1194 domain-containing protein [Mesorhizobium sp.]RWQ81380.1 MAG: DUF1194 domain-containing protein [Mesorhizobium sp.]